MRILLFADIHGNWPALKTLDESFDLAVCLGDLVDYALEPGPCIEWVRTKCRYAVRGNHDHGVAQNVKVQGKNGFRYLTSVTRPLSRERLGAQDIRFLAHLPLTQLATVDEAKFLFVHATPRDAMDEYAQPDSAAWERRLQGVDADVICVGHTHQPYVLEIGGKLVINPGSLGQPRDGDPRAAYAVIDNRRVELKRFEYPFEDTVRVIQESSLPQDAKEMLAMVYRTGRTSPRPVGEPIT